jgi:hypothetical protein
MLNLRSDAVLSERDPVLLLVYHSLFILDEIAHNGRGD